MTQFKITVSEDKLLAKLTGEYDGNQSKDELIGEVLLLLENQGIIHGVSESMIENAIDKIIADGNIAEAVVALGEHPGREDAKGPTFTVPFYSSEQISDRSFLDTNNNEVLEYYKLCEFVKSPYIVKKNEVIGVDESWNENGGGIDIYGEPISNYGNNASIAALSDGIRIDKKNGNIIAIFEGVLLIHNRKAMVFKVNVYGGVDITISEDKLNAYMSIYPSAPGNKKLHPSEVYTKLKEQNIINGVIDKNIEGAFKILSISNNPIINMEIARGNAAIEGENEKIKYLVNLSFSGKPYLNEHGKADYFKIHTFENVKKDQPLAKIIPAKAGQNGKDVFGAIIEPKSVKRCEITPGNNVAFHNQKQNILISKISGHVYVKQKKLVVEKVLKINENVDFKTGNINFEGDVEVKGDVPSGFAIRATGNIVIGGTVEDAFLRAEESVIIKGGFVGKGAGRVKAGKDVVVKHVLNQTILAQNDIMIAGEAVDSKLYAGNEMFVEIKKSWIIGGWAVAGKKLYANALGNMSGVKTEIFCGTEHFIRKILDEIAVEITILEEEAAAIKEKMRHPELNSVDMSDDPDYKESLAIQLRDIRKRQEVKHNKLKTFRSMQDKIEIEPKGEIGIRDTVYPGVILHIANLKYSVTDGMKQIVFYYYDDQIKMRPFI